ncbi:hypothetical protein ABPG74_021409 [Tetrahymena malaccensis]
MMIVSKIKRVIRVENVYKNLLFQLNQFQQCNKTQQISIQLQNRTCFQFCSKPHDKFNDSTHFNKVGSDIKRDHQSKKSSEYEQNSILKQLELDEFQIPKNYKNCTGCGVRFQIEHENKLGYIDKKVLKEIVDHNKRIDEEIENGDIIVKRSNQFDESDYISRYMIQKNKLQSLKNTDHKQFIEIEDLDMLEEIESKKENMTVYKRKEKNLKYRKPICYRCHQLKYQKNLIDQQSEVSRQNQQEQNTQSNLSEDENEDEQQESEMTDFEKGDLLATKDPSEFLKKAFKQVKHNSTIIFVVDATDLFATLNTSIVDYAFAQNHKIILAVNKIDALPPNNVQFNLLKSVVKKCILEKYPKSLHLLEDIVLVSAKNGEGMEKITKYIISAKMESKQYQHSRYSKNFYVMGFANTGKSSFINALNRQTKKLLKQQQDQQNNTNPENLNSQDKLMIKKLLGGTSVGGEEDDQELTTSSIPGTTVSFVKSRNKKLNVNIYDTPGIPNPHQLYHYFSNPNDAKIIVVDKKIKPQVFSINKDLSVFFGGLARIDQVQGIDINVAAFMSSHVAVHLTKTYKANEVFIKQYNNILVPVLNPDFTQIIFQRHVIDISFDQKGRCNYDLEIFGLGWLSFTSLRVCKGEAQFFLYLPEGVQYKLRESFYKFDISLMNKKIRTKQVHTNLIEKQKQVNISKLKQN